MNRISPSVLSADYGHLAEALELLTASGADMVHIDVMDGHFVPNITIGAPVVRCLRKSTALPFDVHLMIDEPLRYIADFAQAGADRITFHTEAESGVGETIDAILAAGKEAGLAVKPGTDITEVYPYLDRLSMVLVMTVEPGFGGQSFRADMLPKIRTLREECVRRGLPELDIQVDGGISAQTIGDVAAAGANVFVSGSALFSSKDMAAEIRRFKTLATAAQM
ncbi:MAG TPA: ribulose-phosphate 3-epimerase [Candidatus Fimenecus stercoravium]|nr:ribulose-phosphate 3-epimerase [Candidatus Fimenecus stercoravium]